LFVLRRLAFGVWVDAIIFGFGTGIATGLSANALATWTGGFSGPVSVIAISVRGPGDGMTGIAALVAMSLSALAAGASGTTS
jgi:hypothetical protein